MPNAAGTGIRRPGTPPAPLTWCDAVDVVPRMSGNGTVSACQPLAAAAVAWRTLAEALAARKSMRVWRGHRQGYDHVRRLATVNLPTLPAALPVFNRRGWARTLALDFDVKLGVGHQLAHDVDEAVALITSVGGRVIVDRSPAGGHHVWVPLWAEHRLETLVPVLHAMRRRWPTLDITPMTNPAAGCLTGPGSPCVGGGYRQLLTPLEEAVDAVEQRCQPGTLGALRRALTASPQVPPQRAVVSGRDEPDDDEPQRRDVVDTPPSSGSRKTPQDALDPALHAFATTGDVPSHRPGWTRSEARMAVLVQAVRAGLRAEEVRDCITSGLWRGLAAAFEKYGRRWDRRFLQEWHKAERLVMQRSRKSQLPEHKKVFTGGIGWQRQWLAQALSWLAHTPVPHASPATARSVLQAMGYIAWLSNSRLVSPGGRWLSIAAGMLAEATVWQTLRSLASIEGAPIQLVAVHRGPRADTYELCTPRIHDQPMVVTPDEALLVRVGKVPAVWRTIGHCARETFELIETLSVSSNTEVRKREVKRLARASNSAVDLAFARLAAFGLIETGRGWVRRTPRSLTEVARDHGVQDLVDQRLARHRAEHRSWWTLLELWAATLALNCPDVEQLPEDPLGPAERESWLCAVMATGPPDDPYEPSPRQRRIADAIAKFRNHLGAVEIGSCAGAAARALV